MRLFTLMSRAERGVRLLGSGTEDLGAGSLASSMLAAALVDTRRVYQHVFSIYVPIALGVFIVIGSRSRSRSRSCATGAGRSSEPRAGMRITASKARMRWCWR